MDRKMKTIARLLALAALLGMLAGCSLLVFVEDRLPPPEADENGMVFHYKAPAARQVNVAGEFNNWLGTANGGRLDPNIDALSDPDGDGIWEITLPLPPGRYKYKFVVDQVDWQEDPGNPETVDDNYGGNNSILVVNTNPGYEYDETYISYSLGTGSRSMADHEHTFELAGFDSAREVYVTGSFAEWNAEAHAMKLGADGVWRVDVPIDSGEHLYKFVVDGTWIADPDNDETSDDGLGGVNSVIYIGH